ncbi:hypothetical protein PGTUg99_025629 [Puccinia graminis f. sp. tritici]|uniref:Uncharacterized protein n=1 Tax=Puccinia graminis f. sp. tritici TaxID=56615 RepID=A0A5B0NHE1_PUCGR|nr:hypothetical protein PGTUg99_025629 [Puccinia graminis f. sp. tritici]
MKNSTTRTSDGSGAQLQYLGELVIQGFTNLDHKYGRQRTSTREAPWTHPVNEVNSKEVLYERLLSTNLPRLKDQVYTILATLEPVSMKENPELSLRRVLEIQPELDYNITQIDSAFLHLCPESSSACDQTDDQHLKQFKAYSLVELKKEFVFALDWICSAFRAAPEHIKDMRLSTGGCFVDDEFDMSGHKEYTEKAVYWIQHTIIHSQRSEMDAIEEQGKSGVRTIDSLLIDLISLFTPTAPMGFAQLSPLRRQSFIDLAKLTVPIMKLLKLFFKKLFHIGINGCRAFVSYTQMNSEQLKYLCQSSEKVNGKLSSFMYNLSDVDTQFGDLPVDIRSLVQPLEQIASYLEGPLLSIVLYLVPLVDNLPDQTYFQSWFSIWNSQFNIAIHKVVQAAQTFDQNQLG